LSTLLLPSRSAAAILTARLRLMPNEGEEGPSQGGRQVADWRLPALWIGSAGLVVVGIVDIASSDFTGYFLVAAGVAAGVLVYRTVVPLLIWLGVAAVGYYDYISAANTGLFGLAAGLGGAALVVSCIVRPAPRLMSNSPVQTPAPSLPHDSQLAGPATATIDDQFAPASEVGESQPDAVVQPSPGKPAAEPTLSAGRLFVRTLGLFEVSSGGNDLTGELLARPMLCFIWLVALVRALTGEERLRRASLADEAAPGLPISRQLQRARGHRRDLRAKLPRVLSERIRDDGEFSRFDLDGVDVDVIELRRLWTQCQEAHGLLSSQLATDITEALGGIGPDEFLPLWEELKDKFNRESTSVELVQQLRIETDKLHARLVLALAQHHRTRGESSLAVKPLQTALEHMPEREDLARALITAYQETGQLPEAEAVRDRYLKEF
jgi:Bacterial transcriptional activator domain